ncbi:hypothetical protein C8A05DRAFT_32067 [Staphylotrichum tortipilum]|uniref:Uncharacterized protein n=1 Tax=Staphylotrichum tortipilum TaxID=2831512 RepID=A0AAN6MNH9_9PEZI|nr:hypothetical protein C8A05DRAFT_32067 [Staphylotrichum longicolle]
MPLNIDISDKNNCTVCGGETDESRIRCRCGDGFYCSRACRKNPDAIAADECVIVNQLPLKTRPTPHHRRALLIQSREPKFTFIWVEVKGSKLVIDEDAIDEHFAPLAWIDREESKPVYKRLLGRSNTKASTEKPKVWLDIAALNPSTNNKFARMMGHGIAIGFASNTLDGKSSEPVWRRNIGLSDGETVGDRLIWPGPVIFFGYGYDMSDYIKVDASAPSTVEHGDEATMSKLEIWNELQQLRWGEDGEWQPVAAEAPPPLKSSSKSTSWANEPLTTRRPNPSNKVWRWKIKPTGTSMKILDILHRDFHFIVNYLAATQLNPLPTIPDIFLTPTKANHICLHLTDPTLPAYNPKLWGPPPSPPTKGPAPALIVTNFSIPDWPTPCSPLAGAFAVGLRFVVRYGMDVNPPFRGVLSPPAAHGRLHDLLWSLDMRDGDLDGQLALFGPTPTCDSIVVAHARPVPLAQPHVAALMKYLSFTDPVDWGRDGPKGFERYWGTYVKFMMGQMGMDQVRTMERYGNGFADPYEREDELSMDEVPSSSHGCVLEETIFMHMSLTGIEAMPVEKQREMRETRAKILKTISMYRKAGGRFLIGTGEAMGGGLKF